MFSAFNHHIIIKYFFVNIYMNYLKKITQHVKILYRVPTTEHCKSCGNAIQCAVKKVV